jgi:protein-S-isoprenylcysteine O-methyltransferase Ste14
MGHGFCGNAGQYFCTRSSKALRHPSLILKSWQRSVLRIQMFLRACSGFFVGAAAGRYPSIRLNDAWLLTTLVPAVRFIAAVVIPREERFLERNFRDQYLSYKATVRRWL